MNGRTKSTPGTRPYLPDPRGQHGEGVDRFDEGSSSIGSPDEGPAADDASSRGVEWASGSVPSTARDRVSSRPETRVPGQDLDPDLLLESFKTGDPQQVYDAFRTLVGAYRDVVHEAGRLRFLVHFGSARCESCEGLKAGPGVVATCHQVRVCNFTNIKEGDIRKEHRMVLEKNVPQ